MTIMIGPPKGLREWLQFLFPYLPFPFQLLLFLLALLVALCIVCLLIFRFLEANCLLNNCVQIVSYHTGMVVT